MRKLCKRYYFSVEGGTEEWYLDHLQQLINNCEKSLYNVKLIHNKEKDPCKMVKALSSPNKITINHFCDIESNQEEHKKNFCSTLDKMREACEIGKILDYKLGYSNFAFDLWMVLHKRDCNSPLSERKQYLKHLNDAFDEHFISMKEYKEEDNFNRCLKKIKLDNVIAAIERAERIMANNKSSGYRPVEYKKFTYYTKNPSLSVHEIIADILRQCKLIP